MRWTWWAVFLALGCAKSQAPAPAGRAEEKAPAAAPAPAEPAIEPSQATGGAIPAEAPKASKAKAEPGVMDDSKGGVPKPIEPLKDAGSGAAPGSAYGTVGARAVGAGELAGRVPTVTGALDSSVVQRVLKRANPSLSTCYKETLASDPTQEGNLRAVLSVAADGSVSSVKVTESFSDGLSRCVSGPLKKLTFPRTEDGKPAEVSFWYTFQSAGE